MESHFGAFSPFVADQIRFENLECQSFAFRFILPTHLGGCFISFPFWNLLSDVHNTA